MKFKVICRSNKNWRSPSSQRVWIEIGLSVRVKAVVEPSPSSQRVWIEIELVTTSGDVITVTLFTEGVD